MAEDWKAYFTFTRRERAGVIVLMLLIAIIYVIPEFLPDDPIVRIEYARDSAQPRSNSADVVYKGDYRGTESRENRDRTIAGHTPVKFYFDPNTLDEKGWERLGIQTRTIRTILNFRSKGGKFRQPDDLRKIYGMSTHDCEQLMPFVRIAAERSIERRNEKNSTENGREQKFSVDPYPVNWSSKTPYETIDINKADSAAWEQLPAIGSKLASRIIMFREKLGGFCNVRQVAETFGISDSAFQVISPYLNYTPTPLRKININSISIAELAKHPYVRWNIASAIINYRNQHGLFRDVMEVKSISALEPGLSDKLLPYLTVE